jgi:UDP-GlcNAc:undecaprenyl-phosphate GlcNAc-1-phosphate transferase
MYEIMFLKLTIIIVFNICIFFILYRIANIYNLLDKPNERKTHINPIPIVGGLIIYFSLILSLYLFEFPEKINLIIIYSSIIVITGFLDDVNQLSVSTRIIFILASCYLLVSNGLIIEDIGEYSGELITLGSFSIIFTILCVTGLTNAFNFLDGQDGLLLVQTVVSYLILFIYTYMFTNHFYFLNFLFVILTISLLGLIYNFGLIKNYKIFLGDSGSMFSGFSIAFILIYFSMDDLYLHHKVLVIWVVSMPIIDFTSTIVRRILKKESPFKPDRTHIHHLFLYLFNNTYMVLFFYGFLGILLSLIGFMLTIYFGPLVSLVCFLILVLFFIIIPYIVEKKLIK